MKFTVKIYIAILFLCFNTTTSQNIDFKLYGLLQDFEEANIFLIDALSRDTIANTNLVDGFFQLTGTVSDYDGFCKPALLFAKKTSGKRSLSFPIALEPGNIVCSFDSGVPVFAGTKNQQKLSAFIKSVSKYEELLRDTISYNKDSLVSEIAFDVNTFYKENSNSALKHFATLLTADFLQREIINPVDLYFDEKNCNSNNSTTIFEDYLCKTIQQVNKDWIGIKAPGFTVDYNKVAFDLDKFIGKKYILLEFWASWCKPCKEQLDKLNAINLGKNSNLEIITISIDSNVANWEKSCKDFNTNWINIIDLKRNIRTQYNVHAVPLTILIDTSGKIISRNPDNILQLINDIVFEE